MTKVTMLVGLPGSGKTTYAKANLNGAVLFDDPSASVKGIEALRHHIQNVGGDIVVTDVYSVKRDVRALAVEKLRAWGVDHIEWVFFENAPEDCIANVKRRNEQDSRFRVIPDGYVREASRQYDIPDGHTIIPVYRP